VAIHIFVNATIVFLDMIKKLSLIMVVKIPKQKTKQKQHFR